LPARNIRTVRISVTGRCDLDCVYCNAAEGASEGRGPRGPELSVDEIVLLADAAGVAGARTVRLTGGEPLLRDDVEEIVSRVRATGRVEGIALTTNARRLAPRARALKDSGLDRVNIGLPSLAPATYRGMTRGELGPALAGIEEAIAAGLTPVKLNVVLMRGRNAHEVDGFVRFAQEKPVQVRFIELMPFAGRDSLVPASEVRRAVAAALGVEAIGDPELSPTAGLWEFPGFAGSVGVISPVTEPFCDRCDRLRVTSDGRLRSCLSEPGETDLRDMLRAGASPEAVARAMRDEFERKPVRHSATFHGSMRGIGG
jgi:cyclic pyranopterin phosphate synthase